jgi:hypothetical protein
MPDRVERLREAAQARHDTTLRRATNALQRLERHGEAVTFRRVAETAGVSRSWLYRQPQLREEITRLRDTTAGRPGTLPSAERATTDSLRQQVRAYRDEITRLRTENQELRDQLARHLGAARAAAATTGTYRSSLVPGPAARSGDHGKASRPRVYVTQSDGCNETLNHPHVGSRGVYTRLRRDGRLTPMASVRGRQCRRLLRRSRTRQAGRTLAPATPPVTLPPSAAGRRPSR